MSSCHWMAGVEICEPPTTTGEPGCCFGNPDAAYSSRWMTACTAFFTERDCLLLTDDMSVPRCAWESLGEYEDCEQVWPTTTASPTDAPGCCHGDSYKANDKCAKATEQGKCEDKGCSWLETDDPDDCVITTTETPTTTVAPGCCDSDVSQRFFDKCSGMASIGQCEKMAECFWVPGADALCEPPVFTSVSPTPAPTDAPGCCYFDGDDFKANFKCNKLTDLGKCERSTTGCSWQETDTPEDCEMTTTKTPTTTDEPGCCDSDTAKKFEM